MTFTTLLLGAVFLAIGYVLSAIAKQRGSAAGMAIGVWLFFVLLYDFALLGILIADKGQHIGAAALNALLLANPTDTYRLLNLSGNVASGLGAQGGIAHGAGAGAARLDCRPFGVGDFVSDARRCKAYGSE